jgi:hypothetical protein
MGLRGHFGHILGGFDGLRLWLRGQRHTHHDQGECRSKHPGLLAVLLEWSISKLERQVKRYQQQSFRSVL